jgi:hypothetical protein
MRQARHWVVYGIHHYFLSIDRAAGSPADHALTLRQECINISH